MRGWSFLPHWLFMLPVWTECESETCCLPPAFFPEDLRGYLAISVITCVSPIASWGLNAWNAVTRSFVISEVAGERNGLEALFSLVLWNNWDERAFPMGWGHIQTVLSCAEQDVTSSCTILTLFDKAPGLVCYKAEVCSCGIRSFTSNSARKRSKFDLCSLHRALRFLSVAAKDKASKNISCSSQWSPLAPAAAVCLALPDEILLLELGLCKQAGFLRNCFKSPVLPISHWWNI